MFRYFYSLSAKFKPKLIIPVIKYIKVNLKVKQCKDLFVNNYQIIKYKTI